MIIEWPREFILVGQGIENSIHREKDRTQTEQCISLQKGNFEYLRSRYKVGFNAGFTQGWRRGKVDKVEIQSDIKRE